MLTSRDKQLIHELWKCFWNASPTNASVVIEQVTVLLFLRCLQDIDLRRQKKGLQSIYCGHEECQWSHIQQERDNPNHLTRVVFPWLRQLKEPISPGEHQDIDLTRLMPLQNKGAALSKAIGLIDDLFACVTAPQFIDEACANLLSQMNANGGSTQFYMPCHQVRSMYQLMDSTTFASAEPRHADMCARANSVFIGDERIIARADEIDFKVAGSIESSDRVLANPPFAGVVDADGPNADEEPSPRATKKKGQRKKALTKKSELLFLWLVMDSLKVGARASFVAPDGLLFGSTDAHIRLRRELLVEHIVEAVISLPQTLFLPFTGTKTSVVLLRKQTSRNDKQDFNGQPPVTSSVFFYEVGEEGASVGTSRKTQSGQKSDLRDALAQLQIWLTRGESEQTAAKGWVVPVREWARNDDWRSADGAMEGSHDSNGTVRPQYVAAMQPYLYDARGALKVGLLNPDCIEASRWDLMGSRYKPFEWSVPQNEKSVRELLDELEATELAILDSMKELRKMLADVC